MFDAKQFACIGRDSSNTARRNVAPHHEPNEISGSELRRGERRNLLAVSHHRDAIGEAQHLVELMRDVDDARSRGNERTNHVLQARFLGDT